MKRRFTEGHWSPYSGQAAEYAHRIMGNTDTVYTNKWTWNAEYRFAWKVDSRGWISVMKVKPFKVAGEREYGYVVYGLSKDGTLREKSWDSWRDIDEAWDRIKMIFKLDIPQPATESTIRRGGNQMKKKLVKEGWNKGELLKSAIEAAKEARVLLTQAAQDIRRACGEKNDLFAGAGSSKSNVDNLILDINTALDELPYDEYAAMVAESSENEWFDSHGDMKKHLPMDCILDCSSGGRVDDSVDYWVNELNFHAPTEKGMSYLQEYGLDDIGPEDVDKYVLWVMCGNIKEEAYEFCRGGMDYEDFETSEYPEDIDDWTEQDWDNFQSEVAICHLGM